MCVKLVFFWVISEVAHKSLATILEQKGTLDQEFKGTTAIINRDLLLLADSFLYDFCPGIPEGYNPVKYL